MSITASAPGKLVLFGDHAAVYSYPCVVTAVDVRFSVTIRPHDANIITVDTPDLRANGETYSVEVDKLNARNRRETAFVEAALKRLFDQSPPSTGFDLKTSGPRVTYGLGSSSAITVATIAAVNEQLGLQLGLRDIFNLSYAAVLDVQGTGSGVDIAAAVYGGTVYYIKGGTTLEPLLLDKLPIVIGYSGEKVSTTNLIAEVAHLRERQPTFIDPLLMMLGDIATQARTELMQANWPAVGDLMNIHQGILDSFGVNTSQLAQLIFTARAAGAIGAKLSGAGGGDCMFALVASEGSTTVANSIEEAGGLPVVVPPHAPGVRIET